MVYRFLMYITHSQDNPKGESLALEIERQGHELRWFSTAKHIEENQKQRIYLESFKDIENYKPQATISFSESPKPFSTGLLVCISGNFTEKYTQHQSGHIVVNCINSLQGQNKNKSAENKNYNSNKLDFDLATLENEVSKSDLKIPTPSSRQAVTAILPVFNESHNIESTLQSVSFADEIMVVDSYSTDDTLDIARKYTDFILQRDFDYPASQKNWAIPQATNEWILLLDADERVTPELEKEILQILNDPDPDIHAYWIYRKNHFMGREVRYSGWQNDKVIRLFKKSYNRYEDKMVHEEIIPTGKVGFLNNRLYHNTYVNLDHYLNKLNKYAYWQARDYDQITGRLTPFHFVLKPFWKFFKHYVIQQGFRDGVVGFSVSFLQSYSVVLRYIKLWLYRRDIK